MKKLTALVFTLIFMLLSGCREAPASDSGSLSAPLETEIPCPIVPVETVSPEKWDLIPMVMVDGILYLDTGLESTVQARCGMMDGNITSTVEGNEKPTVDGQSNFGTGYGYQYGASEDTIEINIDGKWYIFATEEARETIQFPDGQQ